MKISAASALVLEVLAITVFALGCGGGGSGSAPLPPTPPPAAEVITITSNSSIQCVLTVPFTMTLQAQGNSGTLTWVVISGQLPSGLSLDSASGTISGAPTANTANNGGAVIQVSDAKAVTTKQFNFTVWSKLTINPVNPAPAHLNAPYSLSLSAQASSAIAGWTVTAGQLPPGLALIATNVALISGTPTQSGTYTSTVQVQDYTIPQTASLNLTIVVDNHVALIKSTLKNGGQNQLYSDSFTAVNGQLPLHWSLSGSLPAGLSLNSTTGQVSGTPGTFGGFAYSILVSDSSTTAESDSGQGILSIAQQMQIVGTLSPAYIGQPYFSGYSVIGGSNPDTWTLSSGTLRRD